MKTIILISLLVCLVSSCRKNVAQELKECQDFCGGEEKIQEFESAYFTTCVCQNHIGYRK